MIKLGGAGERFGVLFVFALHQISLRMWARRGRETQSIHKITCHQT